MERVARLIPATSLAVQVVIVALLAFIAVNIGNVNQQPAASLGKICHYSNGGGTAFDECDQTMVDRLTEIANAQSAPVARCKVGAFSSTSEDCRQLIVNRLNDIYRVIDRGSGSQDVIDELWKIESYLLDISYSLP